MRSILFLSYYYPPVNNAGTQRIEKFVKFLPQFGFKPIVLTTSYFSPRYREVRSFRLAHKIFTPRSREQVYRAAELRNLVIGRGAVAQNISGYSGQEQKGENLKARLKRFLKTWLLLPDPKVSWLPFAFFKALWLIRKYRVEYLVSSFPPATSHLLGLLLAKCTYIKWVADWRDGWCLDPLDPVLSHSPTRLALEKVLEKIVVKNCDQILVTSPDVGKYLGGGNKVNLFYNGFDASDFTLARKTLTKLKKLENYFVISHPGAFYFSHPGNTPRYFLAALKQVFIEHPEMQVETKVFLLGNLTEAEKEMPRKMGLVSQVKVLGLRSHLDAIRYRLISSVLLLVDRPRLRRSTYIHGKVFEHLASNKAILALLPKESACRDFLEKLGVGEIVEPQDVSGIAKKLWELFSEWKRGGILRYELTEEELEQFERKKLTEKLVEVLEK